MKLRIIPMEAYDGCIPVTVYMVQKYVGGCIFGKWVNIKGFSDKKKGSGTNVAVVSLKQTSSIIFFAMGLDSKLIGNTPGDATSSGGTDLRERFLVKQIQFAPMQQLMLRPLEVITRVNKWDSHLVWQIDREVLTTLDNSKTGVAKQE